MKISYLDIGRRIRSARLAKGLSQEQLAERVGVGTTHISHIETGNTIASMKIFIAIVDNLDVSADALLCDNLEKSKDVFSGEIAEEINDCSEKEIRFIAGMIKAIKREMRKAELPQDVQNQL
ncbi:MAG: helix-turn-helix transcriptional regulator [Oscillospiraceae bacterium]